MTTLNRHPTPVHAPLGLNLGRLAVPLAALSLLLLPVAGRAHCDTLDGPVVKTARASLDSKDVRPVLAWVKPEREREIQAAFQTALEARAKAPTSSEASDHRFYEAVVRIHRAGEGAPYTGLKPAGAGVGEAVRGADLAIESGDTSRLEEQLTDGVRTGVRHRFETLQARRPPGADVAAGREWVEAYVDYVHFVERLDGVVSGGAAHGEGAAHREGEGAAPTTARNGHAHP